MSISENTQNTKGVSTLTIRLIAYAITVAGLVLKIKDPGNVWISYLSWVAYPVFAYLLAMGFDKTSGRTRYFIRLLLFALLAEIPYNYFMTGKFFDLTVQNGMLTLCLGYIVLVIITYVYKKTDNLIISAVVCYFAGYGAYMITRDYGFQFYSFGVMIIIVFYVSLHVKYSRLLQLAFVTFLVFYVTSETFISIIIGHYQYSFPYRAFAYFALIIIWLCNGRRGPNSLPLKVSLYFFYPVALAAAAIAEKFL